MADKWIQEADIKEGALLKQLGIPEDQKIPMSLLDKILIADVGDTIEFSIGGEKKRVKVTRKLQRRVRLAKTLKRLNK